MIEDDDNPYRPGEAQLNQLPDSGPSTFRQFLKLGCGGCLTLIVLLVVLFTCVGVKTSNIYAEFDGQAISYIRSFVENQSPWNFDTAKPELSQRWLQATPDDRSVKLFNYFNKVGTLQSIASITKQGCSARTDTVNGSIDSCEFAVVAEYTEGTVLMTIGLIRENDRTKVLSLNVRSDAFLELD